MIAIYKRLSLSDGDLGVDGKDESNSIENQQLMIEQYLDSKEEFNGIDRITYSDDGYTGTDFNRPGFKEMIDAAKSGKIDTIVVKDVSRFGRDYIGVGEYLEQIFPILNIRFIAINNGYDSKKYSGETLGLDMVVANLVNTMYSRDSGKKLYAANSVKWKQGISTYANTTFGYKKDPNRKGRYIIDPDAAKIVRRLFDLALEGRTTTQIAAQLNEEKVPVPYEYNQQTEDRKSVGACKPIAEKVIWSSRRVLRILKKYEYTGAMVIGRRITLHTGGKVRRNVPESEWFITDDVNEPIVSKEEWKEAQGVIQYRGNAGKMKQQTKFPLKGKLLCATCHRRLTYQYQTYDTKLYCFEGMEMRAYSPCSNERYSLKEINAIVLHGIKMLLLVLDALDSEISEKNNERLKVEKDRQRKKTQLTMQMDRLKADNLRLYEAYSAGHMTKTEYLAEKNAFAEKLTTLQEQIEQLFSELPGAVSVNKEIHNMFSKTNLFDSETELTRELVEAFIDHIYVGENKKLEIHYKSEDALRKLLAEFNMQVPQECGL